MVKQYISSADFHKMFFLHVKKYTLLLKKFKKKYRMYKIISIFS